jgi:hypothetical protein
MVVLCTCGCARYIARKTVLRHLHGKGTQEVLVSQQNKLVNSLQRRRIKSSRDRKSSRKNDNLGSMSTSEDVRDAPTPHSNSLSKSLPNSPGPLNEDQLQLSPDTATIELPVPDRNDLLQDLPIESPPDSPIHFDTFPTDDNLDCDSRLRRSREPDDISKSNQVNARLFEESGVWRFPDSTHPRTTPRSIRPAVESDNEGSDSTSDLEEITDDVADSSEEECLDDDLESWGEDGIDVQPWLREMPAINELDEEFELEAAARGMTYMSLIFED